MTLRDRIRCLRRVLQDIDAELDEGVLPCPHCGYDHTLSDLDVRLSIRAALKADDRAARSSRKETGR